MKTLQPGRGVQNVPSGFGRIGSAYNESTSAKLTVRDGDSESWILANTVILYTSNCTPDAELMRRSGSPDDTRPRRSAVPSVSDSHKRGEAPPEIFHGNFRERAVPTLA